MAMLAPSNLADQSHPSARKLIKQQDADETTTTNTTTTETVSISINNNTNNDTNNAANNNQENTTETNPNNNNDTTDEKNDESNSNNSGTIMSLPTNDSLTQHPSARQLIKKKKNSKTDELEEEQDINISLKTDKTDNDSKTDEINNELENNNSNSSNSSDNNNNSNSDNNSEESDEEETGEWEHPKTGQFGFTKRMSMPGESPVNTHYRLRVGSVTDELLNGPMAIKQVLNEMKNEAANGNGLNEIAEYSDNDIVTENESETDSDSHNTDEDYKDDTHENETENKDETTNSSGLNVQNGMMATHPSAQKLLKDKDSNKDKNDTNTTKDVTISIGGGNGNANKGKNTKKNGKNNSKNKKNNTQNSKKKNNNSNNKTKIKAGSGLESPTDKSLSSHRSARNIEKSKKKSKNKGNTNKNVSVNIGKSNKNKNNSKKTNKTRRGRSDTLTSPTNKLNKSLSARKLEKKSKKKTSNSNGNSPTSNSNSPTMSESASESKENNNDSAVVSAVSVSVKNVATLESSSSLTMPRNEQLETHPSGRNVLKTKKKSKNKGNNSNNKSKTPKNRNSGKNNSNKKNKNSKKNTKKGVIVDETHVKIDKKQMNNMTRTNRSQSLVRPFDSNNFGMKHASARDIMRRQSSKSSKSKTGTKIAISIDTNKNKKLSQRAQSPTILPTQMNNKNNGKKDARSKSARGRNRAESLSRPRNTQLEKHKSGFNLLKKKNSAKKKNKKTSKEASNVKIQLKQSDTETVEKEDVRVSESEEKNELLIEIGKKYELDDGRIGICQFQGTTDFGMNKNDIWIGLIIDYSSNNNKSKAIDKYKASNGRVNGKKYFDCNNGKGVMIAKTKIVREVGNNE